MWEYQTVVANAWKLEEALNFLTRHKWEVYGDPVSLCGLPDGEAALFLMIFRRRVGPRCHPGNRL